MFIFGGIEITSSPFSENTTASDQIDLSLTRIT